MSSTATTLVFNPEAICGELTDAFHLFNRHLFADSLPVPSFRIDLEKRWAFRLHPPLEFVIGKEMHRLSLYEMLCELVHEMVHLRNAELKRQDCTTNGYHNQWFADVCLDIGLFVGKHRNHGWGITFFDMDMNANVDEFQSPKDEVSEHLRDVVDIVSEQFSLDTLATTQAWMKRQIAKRPAKVYQLKYTCGCPAPFNSVRSGRRPAGEHALRAVCRDCGEDFKPEEDEN